MYFKKTFNVNLSEWVYNLSIYHIYNEVIWINVDNSYTGFL